MRLVISAMGDHVLVEAVDRGSTMLETITPEEAKAYARRLIFASAKAKQNAAREYRQPEPEGSTVGEVEAG